MKLEKNFMFVYKHAQQSSFTKTEKSDHYILKNGIQKQKHKNIIF